MSTITTTLVTPAVTLSPVEATVTSAKKLTQAERTVASAFAHWASVSDQADEATLLLTVHLLANESVSARRASELATEVLGTSRGWSKDKVTAVRWTAPVWELLASPDHQADDYLLDEDGERLTVADLISEVRTIASVIGSAKVREALASVDEPSVVAYISALRDARDAKALGAENTPPAGDQADDEAEAEAETKSGWTLDHALATAIAKARKEGISDADILASFALAVTTLNTEGV